MAHNLGCLVNKQKSQSTIRILQRWTSILDWYQGWDESTQVTIKQWLCSAFCCPLFYKRNNVNWNRFQCKKAFHRTQVCILNNQSLPVSHRAYLVFSLHFALLQLTLLFLQSTYHLHTAVTSGLHYNTSPTHQWRLIGSSQQPASSNTSLQQRQNHWITSAELFTNSANVLKVFSTTLIC